MKGERKEKKRYQKQQVRGIDTNPEKLSDKTAAQRGERGAKKGTAGLNFQRVFVEKERKEKGHHIPKGRPTTETRRQHKGKNEARKRAPRVLIFNGCVSKKAN